MKANINIQIVTLNAGNKCPLNADINALCMHIDEAADVIFVTEQESKPFVSVRHDAPESIQQVSDRIAEKIHYNILYPHSHEVFTKYKYLNRDREFEETYQIGHAPTTHTALLVKNGMAVNIEDEGEYFHGYPGFKNKGGFFTVASINGFRIGFIGAHLESNSEKAKKTEIDKLISQLTDKGNRDLDAIFFAGDLNYRLVDLAETDRGELESMLACKKRYQKITFFQNHDILLRQDERNPFFSHGMRATLSTQITYHQQRNGKTKWNKTRQKFDIGHLDTTVYGHNETVILHSIKKTVVPLIESDHDADIETFSITRSLENHIDLHVAENTPSPILKKNYQDEVSNNSNGRVISEKGKAGLGFAGFLAGGGGMIALGLSSGALSATIAGLPIGIIGFSLLAIWTIVSAYYTCKKMRDISSQRENEGSRLSGQSYLRI